MSHSSVVVWDRFVRIFHWSIASLFALNYFITEEGGDIHELVGYSALGLIAARIVWGFVTQGPARWAAFWPTPARLKSHWSQIKAGQPHRALTHSPMGAVVMITMLLGLALLAITGFAMQEIDYFWGDERLEEIHESIANGVAALAVVHILGGIVQSLWLRENLIWSMITGRRRGLD
jgi:cytochrome b